MIETFPVMAARILRAVPWAFVVPHEPQCQRNHSQTLRRLLERGGLDPSELLAVLEDRSPFHPRVDPIDAEVAVLFKLSAWYQEKQKETTPCSPA